ncbi:hypothetical protein GCM10023205_22530 [Yinghuangia aomiensis]|uniref:Uncharacterized protein n=1 Tax=Yinghuangia aomiensis TaxID=676205 RepID=A0ABP9H106_9ACTN
MGFWTSKAKGEDVIDLAWSPGAGPNKDVGPERYEPPGLSPEELAKRDQRERDAAARHEARRRQESIRRHEEASRPATSNPDAYRQAGRGRGLGKG